MVLQPTIICIVVLAIVIGEVEKSTFTILRAPVSAVAAFLGQIKQITMIKTLRFSEDIIKSSALMADTVMLLGPSICQFSR